MREEWTDIGALLVPLLDPRGAGILERDLREDGLLVFGDHLVRAGIVGGFAFIVLLSLCVCDYWERSPRRHSEERRTCDLCFSSLAWRQMPEEIRGSSFLRMTVKGRVTWHKRAVLIASNFSSFE